MHHISEGEIRLINWLPINERVDRCIYTITYNFVNHTCPYCLNEIFEFALCPHCRIDTQNIFSKLPNSFYKTNMGQKISSSIGPFNWNSLPNSIKNADNLNTFNAITHNVYMLCVSVFTYVCMSMGVCIYTYGHILVCFLLIYLGFFFVFLFFFSFTLFSHFCSDLRDHNENKMFLSVLCYPSHC